MQFIRKFTIILGLSIILGFAFSHLDIVAAFTRNPSKGGVNVIDYTYEGWSFKFDNYPVIHQGKSVIDLEISYRYKDGIGKSTAMDYPDFVPIYKFIDNFLVNYPNETDAWEIVNKNLTKSLLTTPIPTPYGIKYQLANFIDSLTAKLNVRAASANLNMPRSSTVTAKPPHLPR
jgi:hypothetical protein